MEKENSVQKEKQKALQLTLEKIEKSYGKGTIMRMGDNAVEEVPVIKTGSVEEVAVVLRDLFLLSVDKDLSYGERKMLDTAKNLLVKELSLAQNTEESAVSKTIEAIFS